MQEADKFLSVQEKKFHSLFDWLKSAMPASFFELVTQDDLLYLVSTLVDLSIHGPVCQIRLGNMVILLSLDTPEVSRELFRHQELKEAISFHLFLSLSAVPQIEKKLVVVCLFYEESHEFFKGLSSQKQQLINRFLEMAQDSDQVHCQLIRPQSWEPNLQHSLELVMSCRGAPRAGLLTDIADTVSRNGIKFTSLSATLVSADKPDRIFLLSGELHGVSGVSCWECVDVEKLTQELSMVRYFATNDLFLRSYEKDGQVLPFLRSVSLFVHQCLVHVDPNMFSLDNVREAFCYWPELGMNLFRLFCFKSDPFQKDLETYLVLREKLLELIDKQDTGKEYADYRRKSALKQGVFFVDACLKTNFFVPNKTALSYRLDPAFFKEFPKTIVKHFAHQPFGIFFIYQRDFFGFHVRFQDLARGGLRTINIHSRQVAMEESPSVFLECYQLAWTQQKKNKDIPEGGSKGIVFLLPSEDLSERQTFLYRSQRIFVENLVQLVNSDGAGQLKESQILDYYGKPEYLYLGPDENMHDVMIEWIAKFAKQVGYKPGAAFITSKPKTGINHKRYGVTSLGVNVCMQEVLRSLKIEPTRDLFTVKMAGGPDGDVAGNQILNLFRHYPSTAKLVSLIDISGVIHDPEGLDLAFLKELFEQSKPIRYYPPEKLSRGGFLLDLRSKKREGVHIIKTLVYRNKEGKIEQEWLSGSETQSIVRGHVHAQVADVFIPAGGRPATLNSSNVMDFLDEKGVPTSKVIVEGANLYLTQEAREALEQKGALIIKDSSANKGGVICSSFEVLTSLALTDDECLANKEQIAAEILEKIEQYANLEVQLILATHAKTGAFCSLISEQISERINLFASQIRDYLAPLTEVQLPLMACFYEYVLSLLATKFQDSLARTIPDVHKKAIIASWIASKVVYTRGLDWSPTIVDVLPFLSQDPTIASCPIH